MYPQQQADPCQDLQQRIAQLTQQLILANQELERREQVIKNQQANVADAQRRADESALRGRQIETEASGRWREVAVMLEAELPDRAPGLEYQGAQLYSKEYVFGIIVRLKASLQLAEQVNRDLLGRVRLQQIHFAEQMKQIGSQVAETMLRIEAPKTNLGD